MRGPERDAGSDIRNATDTGAQVKEKGTSHNAREDTM
jgi:hypothetical protein